MNKEASTAPVKALRSQLRVHARGVSNAAVGVVALLFWLVSNGDDA